MIRRVLVAFLVVTAGLLALSAAAQADPGDLDPAWSSDGILIGEGARDAAAGATQSSGALVIAGGQDNSRFGQDASLYLARFSQDGVIDPSFGFQGERDIRNCRPAVELAVLAGDSLLALSNDCLVKLDSDGDLDPDFSHDGVAPVHGATDLAVDPQGRVLVASIDGGATVTRFGQDGRLDVGYGDAGEAFIAGLGGSNGIQLGLDGSSALVAGVLFNPEPPTDSGPGVVKLSPNGTVDSGFGEDGVARIDLDNVGSEVGDALIQEDGSIVLTGSLGFDGSSFYVARFDSSGLLDSTFGDGGRVTGGFGGGVQATSALAVEPGGKLLVAGVRGYDCPGRAGPMCIPQRDATLLRLLPDGDPDLGFGNGGLLELDLDGFDYGSDLVLDGAGVFLVGSAVGSCCQTYSGKPRVLVTRHLLGGTGSDLDADGVADDLDPCPTRFNPVGGCPQYQREIDVIKTKATSRTLRALGYVDSVAEACTLKDPDLERRNGGGWKLVRGVEHAVSGSGFALELRHPKPGPYRLSLERSTSEGIGTCSAAKPVRLKLS